MDNFEKWWNERSKFWKGIRTGDHDIALEALGYWRTSPGPTTPQPRVSDTPETTAASKCGTVCGLISVGLINHHSRLNETYWRQARMWLEKMDAATPGMAQALDDLIDQWHSFGIEAGQSRGVWDLMEAASFRTWMDQLIAAMEQYRDACAALQQT
ncbi:MAG: hypothetical protein AAB225_25340 [Acidobacteriota bacterium]